jgi:hypothetical protein
VDVIEQQDGQHEIVERPTVARSLEPLEAATRAAVRAAARHVARPQGPIRRPRGRTADGEVGLPTFQTMAQTAPRSIAALSSRCWSASPGDTNS